MPDFADVALAAGALAVVTIAVCHVMVATSRPRQRQPRLTRGRLAGAAGIIYALGTMTWRIRSAEELANAPVDNAAAIRLACNVVALLLIGVAALQHDPERRARQPRLNPAALYVAYMVVALIGTTTAVRPGLVAFRVFDLGVAVAVGLGLAAWCSPRGLVRGLFVAHVAVLGLLALSFAISPGETLMPGPPPVGIRLQGVFPALSYNSVGTFGVVIFAFALALGKGYRWALLGGLFLVLAAQYRTGYVVVAAVICVFLALHRKTGARLLVVLAVPALFMVTQSATFQEAWIRGEEASRSAQNLSGRLEFWARGLDVVERSPWIGTGLSSGVRYEVFAPLGLGSTSTIHGTWVEAYVGTGVIGTALLAAFFVWAIVEAVRCRDLTLVPILFMTVMAVRSITGTTVELASTSSVVITALTVMAWRINRDPALWRGGVSHEVSAPGVVSRS